MGLVLRTIGAFAALSLAGWASAQAADLQVLAPYVQAAPPNAKVLAAYMGLRNAGTKNVVVVGASSPEFARVEMHRTVLHGDQAHMEATKELALPAQASLELKPGGWHLMLIEPKKRLPAGAAVSLRLHLQDGGTVAVTAPVVAKELGQAAHHTGHHAH